MRVLWCAAVLAGLSVPAAGKTTFAAYEGVNAERAGTGGTKIQRKGIDYWTTGEPPRRYRILGVIFDTRTDKLLAGDALNSDAVAKKVREAGGSAVIVVGQSETSAGSNALFQRGLLQGSVSGTYRDVKNRRTEFVVVKYLD